MLGQWILLGGLQDLLGFRSSCTSPSVDFGVDNKVEAGPGVLVGAVLSDAGVGASFTGDSDMMLSDAGVGAAFTGDPDVMLSDAGGVGVAFTGDRDSVLLDAGAVGVAFTGDPVGGAFA